MNETRLAAAPLLHNTGVPPRSAINHPGSRVTQRGLWLALPATNWKEQGAHVPLSLDSIAAWLGVLLPGTQQEQERVLGSMVNAHAETLPFPPACVVASHRNLAPEGIYNPLTIITVLSKSSGHVYLRDKEPNFDRLVSGASLALIIPNEWSPA